MGFQQTGISDIDLSRHQQHLEQWLAKHYHGEMQFMEKHGSKRSHPEQLLPGTLRAITVRMDYLPTESELQNTLNDGHKAYISRYALGRDYHKLMRKRLAKLAEKISSVAGPSDAIARASDREAKADRQLDHAVAALEKWRGAWDEAVTSLQLVVISGTTP